MSWHESWLAVRGVKADELLRIMGLEETGEVDWWGGAAKPYSYAPMPGGWTVICADFYGLADLGKIRELSRCGLVLACHFQDQVEAPSAGLVAARNGEALWEIHTVGDELTIKGSPPAEFGPIRDRYAAQIEEDSVIMYHVPIDLGEKLCGFRHEKDDRAFRGLRPLPDSSWRPERKLPAYDDGRATHADPVAWAVAVALVIVPLVIGLLGIFYHPGP